MGDYESRMEDARQEVAIDRAIRRGEFGDCHVCGREWFVKLFDLYDDAPPVPMCSRCIKEHEARY